MAFKFRVAALLNLPHRISPTTRATPACTPQNQVFTSIASVHNAILRFTLPSVIHSSVQFTDSCCCRKQRDGNDNDNDNDNDSTTANGDNVATTTLQHNQQQTKLWDCAQRFNQYNYNALILLISLTSISRHYRYRHHIADSATRDDARIVVTSCASISGGDGNEESAEHCKRRTGFYPLVSC